jgi:SSS family solute:Na+ symporter
MLKLTSDIWIVLASLSPSAPISSGTTARTLFEVLLPLYLALSLLIGWVSRRHAPGANSFLNASRSLPSGVVVFACVAANCGAFEVIGMSAAAAQYGIVAAHFFLIGAIPAILYCSLRLMPIYRALSVRSVPQFLEVRYGSQMRLLNAGVVGCILLLLGGISLFAVAQFLEVVAGWSFWISSLTSATVVLLYVVLGGLRATIYNELLQLAVVLLGLLPLGLSSLRLLSRESSAHTASFGHLWVGLPIASVSSPFDVLGVLVGLGFVLGAGYWCTDFVLMQRAFTARTERAAQQAPLWTGLSKLFFAVLVICPGLVAARLFSQLGVGARYEQAIPLLMQRTYGPVMLSIGSTALAASLLSGVGANVAAFASLWTEDIYRSHLRPGCGERHYLLMGRCAVVFAVTVAILDSSITFRFGNIIEHVQVIFTVFGTPFWAIFLMGVLSRRITTKGAFAGFFAGLAMSATHLALSTFGVLRYGSIMSASFHAAIYTFVTACLTALGTSLLGNSSENRMARDVADTAIHVQSKTSASTWILAAVLVGFLVGFDWYLR